VRSRAPRDPDQTDQEGVPGATAGKLTSSLMCWWMKASAPLNTGDSAGAAKRGAASDPTNSLLLRPFFLTMRASIHLRDKEVLT
jgi:hypothetical protein